MLKKIKFRSLLGNSWVLLILAVLVAGGLTFLLYKYLTDREAKLKADLAANRQRAGVEVVVPAQDVPFGTPLSSDQFVAREIAPDMVYDDMIRADDFQQYRMSHLVKAVRRGLPLRAGDIDALRGRDFSDMLPVGQRALTVEIDTVNSTSSMVRPGNHVDIYWLVKQQGVSEEKKMAQLVKANVLVLATGQDVRPRDAGEAQEQDSSSNPMAMQQQANVGYGTVTLQVSVEDAPRIALAQRIGGLRLILRNADDKGTDLPANVKENDLLGPVPEKGGVAVPVPVPVPVVEVIAGGGASNSVLVPDGNPSTAQSTPAATPEPANTAKASGNSPSDPANASRQPSLYEQANAIAQELQKAGARGASTQK